MRGTNGQTLLRGPDAPRTGEAPGSAPRPGRSRLARRLGAPAGPAVLEDAAPYAGLESAESPGPEAVPESAGPAPDRAVPVEVLRAPVPLCALRLEEQETGRLIAALGSVVRRGVPLFCLDGGNAFNPYRLAVLLRREGVDPGEVLDRIYVSRAYTCHQLAASAETLLGALLGARPRPIVAVLGIDRLFHDEDLPLWEREFLYGRLLAHVRALHRRGLPVLLTFGDDPRGSWATRLRSVARIVPGPEAVLVRLEAGLFGAAPVPARRTEHPEMAPEVFKANPTFLRT